MWNKKPIQSKWFPRKLLNESLGQTKKRSPLEATSHRSVTVMVWPKKCLSLHLIKTQHLKLSFQGFLTVKGVNSAIHFDQLLLSFLWFRLIDHICLTKQLFYIQVVCVYFWIGAGEPGVHASSYEDVLLSPLPRHGLCETLCQLLQQCHEGLSGQPGWPQHRVETSGRWGAHAHSHVRPVQPYVCSKVHQALDVTLCGECSRISLPLCHIWNVSLIRHANCTSCLCRNNDAGGRSLWWPIWCG